MIIIMKYTFFLFKPIDYELAYTSGTFEWLGVSLRTSVSLL